MAKENPVFIANLKQSGRRKEISSWVNAFSQERDSLANKLVIFCPPHKGIDLAAELIENAGLPIAVGIQDIDARVFEGEKNTASESPTLLADSVTYVIIGHSETRRNYHLTDADVAEKVRVAQMAGLKPVVCVEELKQAQALKELFGNYEGIIAYEPPAAIGTGNAANPKDANDVATTIKKIFPNAVVLYGGSVDDSNIKSFMEQENIGGVLVGNRSLDASFFLEIVKNA